MIVDLLGSADRARAGAFLEAQGLLHDGSGALDDLVGAFEGGELVATGARAGGVLKLVAIDPARQGGPLLGEVVGELVRRGAAAGHDALSIFTAPAHAGSFEALNFRLLASHGRAALLEWGGGLERWLAACRPLLRPGPAGAAVLNANPFTLGHRHLVEEAARRVPTLYLFVVREDVSAFPFEARLRLVREGTRDLANVVVLDTSRYAVSAATFPAYFLRQAGAVAEAQMELDLALFGGRIAPAFRVTTRFAGTEPYCETTRAYNAAMRRVLPSLGVSVVEIERRRAGDEPISASAVRAALARGDRSAVAPLVPGSTLAYLLSDEGRTVRERLARGTGRHG
jgi:[citrate (pro-3S)-lyase] ligase